MSSEPDSHSVRRITLPSGRTIEVVRLGPAVTRQHGLQTCPACSSHLVQPVAWGEATGGLWELTLQCPNCDWCTAGIYDQDQVDAFEERLDSGLAAMLGDLRRLTKANMADEIDRFLAALQSNAVLPEDF